MQKKFKVINGQIIRSPKRGAIKFTPLSNSLIQNNELSFEARGLQSYILSLPEDWVLVKSNIRRDANMGRSKFDRIWKELSEKGYIHSEKVRDPNKGVFLGWAHIAYEIPQPKPECGGIHSRITPMSENHTIIKDTINTKQTRIKKKDIKKEGASTSTNTPSFTELFNQGKISSEDAINYINNKL